MKYVFTVTQIYEVEAENQAAAFDVMSNPEDSLAYLKDETLEFNGVE
jgi:hypothetical protein